jgi:hypothetical protein
MKHQLSLADNQSGSTSNTQRKKLYLIYINQTFSFYRITSYGYP